MATGAIGIASLALSAIGTMQSAQQQQQQGAVAQAIGERNARVAEQNAALAVAQAKTEEARIREQAEALKGKQRAAFAASGVEIGTGSPLLVLADTARQAELEALTVRQRGEIERTSFINQASASRFEGEQGLKAGEAGAQQTVLSGAGRLFQAGSKFKSAGTFG